MAETECLLCIGGCADGTRLDIKEDAETIQIPEYAPMVVELFESIKPENLTTHYQVYRKVHWYSDNCEIRFLLYTPWTMARAIQQLIMNYKPEK